MTWISSLDGPTKGSHEEVPKDIREEAEKLAKKALEGDDDDDEDETADTIVNVPFDRDFGPPEKDPRFRWSVDF